MQEERKEDLESTKDFEETDAAQHEQDDDEVEGHKFAEKFAEGPGKFAEGPGKFAE